jgi:hypothetical protein
VGPHDRESCTSGQMSEIDVGESRWPREVYVIECPI